MKRLVDSLDAPGVFCRPPRTAEERENGIMDSRRPDFDWSHIPPLVIDNDPYSKHVYGSSRNVISRRLSLQLSLGASRQMMGRPDRWSVVKALIKEAVKKKGAFDPFGVALTEDDKLVKVGARKQKTISAQRQADLVSEKLALLCDERPIKAAGMCLYGAGPVPGLDKVTTAFKIHLETAASDAYILYLPFEEKNGERDYATLLVEPDD